MFLFHWAMALQEPEEIRKHVLNLEPHFVGLNKQKIMGENGPQNLAQWQLFKNLFEIG